MTPAPRDDGELFVKQLCDGEAEGSESPLSRQAHGGGYTGRPEAFLGLQKGVLALQLESSTPCAHRWSDRQHLSCATR